MSVVSVLTYFFLLQRFQLAMAAIMCIAVLYYATRHLRFTTVGLYLLGGSLFFYWISTLRSGLDLFIYYLHRNSQMKFSPAYAIFTEPYMYVVMNLENFARSIEKLDHFTLGYFTLDPIFAFVGLKHWVIEYFGLNYTPYLISGYNTYTAYWWYYRDFGAIGIAFIPLLLGIVIGILYYRMRRNPSLTTISAYGVSVFIMMVSFFNNPLQFLWFVYNLSVIYFTFRLIRSRRASPGT
jgi:oligosaccharide repeat unit polymerase